MCRLVELGDTLGPRDECIGVAPISVRIDAEGLTAYRNYTKKRSVPHVLVYGDFDDSKTRSQVARAYDLVKQKYPRTEFRLVAPALIGRYESPGDKTNGSFVFCYPRTEQDMQKLFSEADTLMLVSAGGINRHFISRARAAGHPVIVSDLDYSGGDTAGYACLSTPRGSYTDLAQAVISLVDDETYYRSFQIR
jgi:hypothetical protein